MKQFKIIIITFASILALCFAACGSDSGPAQAETVYGLGECEESNDGVIKLVTSEDQYYKCVDGDWEETEAPLQSSSSKNSQFARSSSSNNALSGLGKQSSTSSGFFSTDSKSGYNPVNQTLTDSRDGQVYRTTKIGDQVWMAENLNYRYLGPTAELDSSSFCYDNNPVNCTKYGRLYLWSAATDSAGIIKGNIANGCGYGSECCSECSRSETVRGVCPQGWHLPSYNEWDELFMDVAGSHTTAGKMLKSETGWKSGAKNTDVFGFSALPAGFRGYKEIYDMAYFWCSTESSNYTTGRSKYNAYSVHMSYSENGAYLTDYSKLVGFSVRCLKD